MYNAQNTADCIKKILIDKNLTAKSMCQSCKIGVNALSNIRRGDIKNIEAFYSIADFLDCSIDYLVGRSDTPNINGNNISTGNTGVSVGNYNSSININAKDTKSNDFDSTTIQVAEAFQDLDFDDKFEVMQLLMQKKKSK